MPGPDLHWPPLNNIGVTWLYKKDGSDTDRSVNHSFSRQSDRLDRLSLDHGRRSIQLRRIEDYSTSRSDPERSTAIRQRCYFLKIKYLIYLMLSRVLDEVCLKTIEKDIVSSFCQKSQWSKISIFKGKLRKRFRLPRI